MKIYLAGSVPKGDKEQVNSNNWRKDYQEILRNFFDAQFIDPYYREVDESDFLAVVGLDCKHIKESDLIIINSEWKLGVGTAQEMIVAKYFNKPVITVLPKNTHHRRQNVVFHGKTVKDWIHPFIHTFSDFVIENIKDINEIKNKLDKAKIKKISIIDEAVKYIENK